MPTSALMQGYDFTESQHISHLFPRVDVGIDPYDLKVPTF